MPIVERLLKITLSEGGRRQPETRLKAFCSITHTDTHAHSNNSQCNFSILIDLGKISVEIFPAYEKSVGKFSFYVNG